MSVEFHLIVNKMQKETFHIKPLKKVTYIQMLLLKNYPMYKSCSTNIDQQKCLKILNPVGPSILFVQKNHIFY